MMIISYHVTMFLLILWNGFLPYRPGLIGSSYGSSVIPTSQRKARKTKEVGEEQRSQKVR